MKKTIKNALLVSLLLTLCISTLLFAYLYYSVSDDKEISGEWTASLDMTQQAAVAALSWLQDIEAVSISLEEMESYMQDLTIQVNLTLEQTGRNEGTFQSNVVPESYDACSQAAYEAFAMAFQELLAERLHMAGYTGGMDRESLEELVTEAFGMDTVSYLVSCGPALLPSLEALQAEYDGSGTYEISEDILTRAFESGGDFGRLPSYTEDFIPSKRQNSMSTEDMFRLVSWLLKVYPQVRDITSQEKATLESLELEVRNTNPLIHNLSEVTGLKTGTTNKAGACLVTSLTADDGSMEHDLAVIVLGAEDSIERGRVSELLARYALNAFYTGQKEPESKESARPSEDLPTHAEAAVDRIIRTAGRDEKNSH